jgi:hypothetical protein
MKASRNFMDDEPKILTRGAYYMTPFTEEHVHEFIHVIHPENVRELFKLGHTNVVEALNEIAETCEAYLVRDKDDEIVFVGGLVFEDEAPQMFALFTTKIGHNFKLLARGSKMLVNYFDKTHAVLTMTINANYEAMLNWGAWLGFEPVGMSEHKKTQYVEFVRCNPALNYVSHETSRPVMH